MHISYCVRDCLGPGTELKGRESGTRPDPPLYGATDPLSRTLPRRVRTRFEFPMADRYRCRVENAVVRPEQKETLGGLVRKMFERRHHPRVGGQEKDWLTIELVQALRAESRVYREALSTKTEGPLPFALGYFQLRGDTLELVSDQIPANVAPRTLVRVLSEFLQPGARLWFAGDEREEGWEVRGIGEVVALSTASEAGEDQADNGEGSAGANH